jgi:hypothetical protein
LDAVDQAMQLGLVAHRAVQDGLDGLEVVVHALEAFEQRFADAPLDPDLVAHVTHGWARWSPRRGRAVITRQG